MVSCGGGVASTLEGPLITFGPLAILPFFPPPDRLWNLFRKLRILGRVLPELPKLALEGEGGRTEEAEEMEPFRELLA